MIEITEPAVVLTLKGEDVDKFKSLINQVQRDNLYYSDIEFARELAQQLGMHVYYSEEDTW